MTLDGATVGWLSGGVGFVVPATMGVTLVAAALVVTARTLNSSQLPLVAAGTLLGTLGVLAQLGLAAGAPDSRTAFLLGAAGASCWYGAALRLLAERTAGLSRQWLAVGSLLWIGGTVTVTASAAPGTWPLTWSLLLGAAILAVAVLPRLRRPSDAETGWNQWGVAALSGAFLAPATLGLLAGEDVLFVSYLVVFVTAMLGWSLARLQLRVW